MGLTLKRRETEIQREILRFLRTAVPGLWWRQQSRVVDMAAPNDPRGLRPVRMGGLRGASDLQGVMAPSGRFVAVEVKRPGKKPTPAQVGFLEAVRAAGGIAVVATSVAEVLFLRDAR